MDTLEMALLLLASVKTALANGVKHYNERGELLETPQEIITAMQTSEEGITIDETERVERVTVEEMLKGWLQ